MQHLILSTIKQSIDIYSVSCMIGRDRYGWSNLSKKGTQFCPVEEIPRVSAAIFKRLAQNNLLCGLARNDFIAALVDLYQRTNELHPFREGNGRTQRVFLSQLAENAGYDLDFTAVDPDELMIATIYAAQGIEAPLQQAFEKIVQNEE